MEENKYTNMTALTKPVKKVVIVVDPVPMIKVHDVESDTGNLQAINGSETTNAKHENVHNKSSSRSSMKRQQSILSTSSVYSHNKHVTLANSPDFHSEDMKGYEYASHPRRDQHIGSVAEEREDEVLPEHHQVLYDLLGADKAESILNPKMEEPSKKEQEQVAERSHRKKLPAVDTGLGAEALWKILKQESDKKLRRLDNRIPVDWKVSYGAFLRDSINQNRSLVHRSFTHHTDVPELGKLLDKRYKTRVRKARHHANVMFRSSENNKNKTSVLLANNPVPDYTDRDGILPVTRYFHDDLAKPEVYDSLPRITKQHYTSSADFREKVAQRFANLDFLSEDRARCKGTFYGKYASIDAVKMVTDFPGYKSKLPPSMTSRVTLSAQACSPGTFRGSISQGGGARRLHSQKHEPTWQPLTVGALMEYAPTKRVVGVGDFRFGQVSRWRTPAPSTA